MKWTNFMVVTGALLLTFAVAVAHQGGMTGYATVSVVGQSVRYSLTLPAEGLGDTARDLRALSAAVARYVTIESDGAACVGVPAESSSPSTEHARVEVVVLYACATAIHRFSIRDGIDALLGADHHTITDIQWLGGGRQVIFEKDRRSVSVVITPDVSRSDVPGGSLASYLRLGVEHIIGGIDHLLFLLALLALTKTIWQTVKVVTAFTAAHSITLSLAVLGMVDVPSSIVEPLIAASIVWVAMENLLAPAGFGRRWLVAAVFGLVHGLGFASALSELGLPREALVRALLGFNIGVELGQLVFVVAVMPPLAWASRPGCLPHLPQFMSGAVALTGMAWFVQRLTA